MRLTIADPPYLGRAIRWYHADGGGRGYGIGIADHHDDATEWDDPASVPDVLRAGVQNRRGFVGAKPPRWTRWVLDLLGYDAETDTVDDLFPGSGAVAAEISQGVLI